MFQTPMFPEMQVTTSASAPTVLSANQRAASPPGAYRPHVKECKTAAADDFNSIVSRMFQTSSNGRIEFVSTVFDTKVAKKVWAAFGIKFASFGLDSYDLNCYFMS